MNLTEYYQEVVKTAGLVQNEAEVETAKVAEAAAEVDTETEEKVAAVVAVAEQFDIDGIAFENEDEKIAAALAVVTGFEEKIAMEADQRKAMAESEARTKAARSTPEKMKDAARNAIAKLKANKGKAAIAGGALAATGAAGYLMGKKKAHQGK